MKGGFGARLARLDFWMKGVDGGVGKWLQ